MQREPHRVVVDALLNGRSHVRRRAEEAVGGHHSVDPLVRTLEVVAVDVQRQPTLAVREAAEDGAAQEFLPQRLPEAFHLPQRLRVLRPALHVPDALPSQLALELRLPAPGRVLPPLVGEHLLRWTVLLQPPGQRLQHELRSLMVRQHVRHDEARVVIHERDQVDPLVPPEQKREDVRLPELVRGSPLEAPRRMLPCFHRRYPVLDQPFLVQDAAHPGLAHPESLEAAKLVPDAPRTMARLLLPVLHHGLALRI